MKKNKMDLFYERARELHQAYNPQVSFARWFQDFKELAKLQREALKELQRLHEENEAAVHSFRIGVENKRQELRKKGGWL